MKRLLASSLLLLAGLSLPGVARAADISINGSTTVLPIMQKVAEQYMAEHPDAKLALSGGGSGNGIKALIDGLADVAMSSREIKSGEVDQAKAKGVDPKQIAVAVDAIVPVVHPDNKVGELSLDELRGIYMGSITNWKDVGGADARIVVVSRDTSSGTYETWETMVMKGERVAPSALLQASNGARPCPKIPTPSVTSVSGIWTSPPRACRSTAKPPRPPRPCPGNGPCPESCIFTPTGLRSAR